jgi:hypothetical protein
MIHLMILGLVW